MGDRLSIKLLFRYVKNIKQKINLSFINEFGDKIIETVFDNKGNLSTLYDAMT